MRIDAPAKINWYLNIVGKRHDGYHEIETVMQTIDLHDTIELEKTDGKNISLTIFGENAKCIAADESNLVVRAARALGVYGVDIKLTKRIPIEAGLGGGSSDAASTMSALNEMFELGYSKAELAAKAAKIGADVPFFIYGGACVARGIGDILTPVEPVTAYEIITDKPSSGLSTKKIYELIDREQNRNKIMLDEFLCHFNNSDRELPFFLFNDMEAVSIPLCPEIAVIKQRLIQSGCAAAMMSGSGSAVFGIK